MTVNIPACDDFVWDVALAITHVVPGGELTKPFRVRTVSQAEQHDMLDALATRITQHFVEHDRLASALQKARAKDVGRDVVREAVHLLRYAYCACSSVYPEDWAVKFYNKRKIFEGAITIDARVRFIAPPMVSEVSAA